MGSLTSPCGSASGLRHVSCGFACSSPYALTPGQPPPGTATLLRLSIGLPTTRSGRDQDPPEGLTRKLSIAVSAWTIPHGYGNINPGRHAQPKLGSLTGRNRRSFGLSCGGFLFRSKCAMLPPRVFRCDPAIQISLELSARTRPFARLQRLRALRLLPWQGQTLLACFLALFHGCLSARSVQKLHVPDTSRSPPRIVTS
jgi:hypothetical protein